MCPAGFEIDGVAMVGFVFAAGVAQVAGFWLVSGVDMPFQIGCEVER